MTITEYNLCVENHADGIYRFILKNLRDPDMAQDVVQDSFEKLWRKYNEVQFEKSKSYLYTTAYHTMIDTIRRRKKSDRLEEAAGELQDNKTKGYSDIKELLNQAIEKLPEMQRSVILLRDYEGYNYREIEEITGLNESQVKVYIYRARKFLMNYIGSLENVI